MTSFLAAYQAFLSPCLPVSTVKQSFLVLFFWIGNFSLMQKESWNISGTQATNRRRGIKGVLRSNKFENHLANSSCTHFFIKTLLRYFSMYNFILNPQSRGMVYSVSEIIWLRNALFKSIFNCLENMYQKNLPHFDKPYDFFSKPCKIWNSFYPKIKEFVQNEICYCIHSSLRFWW